MRSFVTLVICAVVLVPAAALSAAAPRTPLDAASRLSGLRIHHAVAEAAVSTSRYAALYSRAWQKEYPESARRFESAAYAQFGLATHSVTPTPTRAWYDVATHRLLVQRTPAAGRRALIQEYVRALIDQNFQLKRLAGLRARDRDRWVAAQAMVNGTAALASGLRTPSLRGTALDHFAALERDAGVGPGRALAAELRYVGGRTALDSALHTFPQTTEQLLHVDKFLEREGALSMRLPARAGDVALAGSETFGELDARSLLQAFGVPDAAATAAGWGGGRLARYGNVTVIVLRWDTAADAAEWQAAMPHYAAAAFPGVAPHTCPPLDACWGDLAAGVLGTTSVLASGPGAVNVAAALLIAN